MFTGRKACLPHQPAITTVAAFDLAFDGGLSVTTDVTLPLKASNIPRATPQPAPTRRHMQRRSGAKGGNGGDGRLVREACIAPREHRRRHGVACQAWAIGRI